MKALGPRLLQALFGAFAGTTFGWVFFGLFTPGDFYANGSSLLWVTLAVLGALGAFVAFRIRSRGQRIALIAASVVCVLFWVFAPDGWWASPPPPRAGQHPG